MFFIMRGLLTLSLLVGLNVSLAGCGIFDLVSYPFKETPKSGSEAPVQTAPSTHGNENVHVEDLPPPE